MNSISSVSKTGYSRTNASPVSSAQLILWLDAKDPYGTGISPADNTDIALWKDKSGFNRHAQAVTSTDDISSIKYKSAIFNGNYPGLRFIANDRRRFRGKIRVTGNSMRLFIVGSMTNNSKVYARIISFSDDYRRTDHNGSNRWGFIRDVSQTDPVSNVAGTGFITWRANGDLVNNPPNYEMALIWQAWFDGSTRNSKYLNGANTRTVSGESTGPFAITDYAIGSATSVAPVEDFDGHISEILIYNGTLSPAAVSQIEGYLAWKWGLVSTLPDNHTYKNTPIYTLP